MLFAGIDDLCPKCEAGVRRWDSIMSTPIGRGATQIATFTPSAIDIRIACRRIGDRWEARSVIDGIGDSLGGHITIAAERDTRDEAIMQICSRADAYYQHQLIINLIEVREIDGAAEVVHTFPSL